MDQDSGSQTNELPVNGLKGFNAEKDKHESFADVTVCLSVFQWRTHTGSSSSLKGTLISRPVERYQKWTHLTKFLTTAETTNL